MNLLELGLTQSQALTMLRVKPLLNKGNLIIKKWY